MESVNGIQQLRLCHGSGNEASVACLSYSQKNARTCDWGMRSECSSNNPENDAIQRLRLSHCSGMQGPDSLTLSHCHCIDKDRYAVSLCRLLGASPVH